MVTLMAAQGGFVRSFLAQAGRITNAVLAGLLAALLVANIGYAVYSGNVHAIVGWSAATFFALPEIINTFRD